MTNWRNKLNVLTESNALYGVFDSETGFCKLADVSKSEADALAAELNASRTKKGEWYADEMTQHDAAFGTVSEAQTADGHTKYRSVMSFIRKRLGMRGSTEHSGRGSYDCDVTNMNQYQMSKALLNAIPEWKRQGIVISSAVRGRVLSATFSPRHFAPPYLELTAHLVSDDDLAKHGSTDGDGIGHAGFEISLAPGLKPYSDADGNLR